ncbi:hypothetical protein BEI60_13280 [Eisenbergiella tayi]|nr:hypothetical protein BEI60_13280 [Eisenbergiella tayi]
MCIGSCFKGCIIIEEQGSNFMFELLSERLKNKNGEPEVYIYDDFSGEFRNQVFLLFQMY